jgi:hypothetical protein
MPFAICVWWLTLSFARLEGDNGVFGAGISCSRGGVLVSGCDVLLSGGGVFVGCVGVVFIGVVCLFVNASL